MRDRERDADVLHGAELVAGNARVEKEVLQGDGDDEGRGRADGE